MDLTDKFAVTVAGSGIGTATAHLLLERGAHVLGMDNDPIALQRQSARLQQFEPRFTDLEERLGH